MGPHWYRRIQKLSNVGIDEYPDQVGGGSGTSRIHYFMVSTGGKAEAQHPVRRVATAFYILPYPLYHNL